ncbi:unnamed protein product [Lota lota]
MWARSLPYTVLTQNMLALHNHLDERNTGPFLPCLDGGVDSDSSDLSKSDIAQGCRVALQLTPDQRSVHQTSGSCRRELLLPLLFPLLNLSGRRLARASGTSIRAREGERRSGVGGRVVCLKRTGLGPPPPPHGAGEEKGNKSPIRSNEDPSPVITFPSHVKLLRREKRCRAPGKE